MLSNQTNRDGSLANQTSWDGVLLRHAPFFIFSNNETCTGMFGQDLMPTNQASWVWSLPRQIPWFELSNNEKRTGMLSVYKEQAWAIWRLPRHALEQ